MSVAACTIRFALPVLAVGLCGAASGQTGSQGMPAGLPPTSATGAQTPGHAGERNAGAPAKRSEVRYSNGLLTVTARDASLNAILREISQQTGMKVSGGVRDDRVFGTYGPDRPASVLSTLLEGSGSNMLLVNDAADQPSQLILSPRVGGPTPPNQFAAGQQRDPDADDVAAPPVRFGAVQGVPPQMPLGGRPNVGPGINLNPSIGAPTSNNSDSQAVVFPPISATTTPATGTTSSDVTQEPPSGTKTPQQIFEQLQRLRQQQEQNQPQDSNQN